LVNSIEVYLILIVIECGLVFAWVHYRIKSKQAVIA